MFINLRYQLTKVPLWAYTSLLTISVLTLILLTASKLQEQSQKDIGRELLGVLKNTQGVLHFWKDELEIDQKAIANFPIVQSLIQNKLKSAKEKQNLQNSLNFWSKSHGYLGYAIYRKDQDGSLKRLIAKRNISKDLFSISNHHIDKALNNRFIMAPPILYTTEKIITVMVSPIVDEHGVVIGAMAVLVDLLTKFTEATQLGRIGNSGESYAVNELGQMITRSRFKGKPNENEMTSLINHPHFSSQQRKQHYEGYGQDLNGYLDYRGVQTVGVWTWDKELGVGLITEIDKDEAYRSFKIIQRLIWIAITILILAMLSIVLIRELWIRNRIDVQNQKEEFRKGLLSMVSHDLKNPLNILSLSNEMLIKSLPPKPESIEKTKLLLEKSRQAIWQMKRLVTDLLETSSIEKGKLEMHPIPIDGNTLLKQGLDFIQPLAHQKKIQLNYNFSSDLPPILSDPARLTQIFSNLLGNAVKFAPENGKITCNAKLKDDFIVFSITDNGPGILKEDQKHVFERFWQASAGKGLGTGLGLSICKDLILAQGGDIWFKSEVGIGTTFSFSIPVAK